MKILYLTNFFLNKKRGLGLITNYKVSALKALGHDVVLIGSNFDSALLRYMLIFYLDLKAVSIALKFKPDLIISRGPIGFFTLLFAKLFKIKTLREVHAVMSEEVKLIAKGKKIKQFAHSAIAGYSQALDRMSDTRVYNHPLLLKYYQDRGLASPNDFFTYNGYSINNKSTMSKLESKAKFGLRDDYKYLVFVGSATEWHGIDYLVSLQREFNFHDDKIQIVCGGGDISKFDPEGLCLNIKNLNADGCSDLIVASDLCLLPVRNNRVSPGSPLKLYDYIVNDRPVVTQSNMLGYCDEVERYEIGICVDFGCPSTSRDNILKFLYRNDVKINYSGIPVSWEHRMDVWISSVSQSNF